MKKPTIADVTELELLRAEVEKWRPVIRAARRIHNAAKNDGVPTADVITLVHAVRNVEEPV